MHRIKNIEYNPSILISIFKRKGAEGIYTKVIYEADQALYKNATSHLKEKEAGLIIYYKDTQHWLLFSNLRLLYNKDDAFQSLLFTDIDKVDPALQEEYADKITDKHLFTRLKIKDRQNQTHIFKVEAGKPHYGLYCVLHFIACRPAIL